MKRDHNMVSSPAAKAIWVALGEKLEKAANELRELAVKMQTLDVAEGTLGEDGTAALHAMLSLMVLRGDRVPDDLLTQANAENRANFARHMAKPCTCPSCVAERAKPLRERVPNAKLH